MPFLSGGLWTGRIWFWGFIVFFFILGVVGSVVYCCFRGDEGSDNNYGHEHYSNSSCWWIFCGPSYYNGYYYYSPYGYWGPGDILCFYWLMTPHWGFHHHTYTCCDCHGCAGCAGCTSLNDCSGGNDCGKDGLIALLVIVIIVVLVFVIIGVVVGSLIIFLLANKIMKRHLTLLERQAHTQKLIVCNLDDPAEVNEAEEQERDGLLIPFSELYSPPQEGSVTEPLSRPPKSKEFDLY